MAIISPNFMEGPDKFGDPFLLPSTETFPRDIRSTLDLCLYLYRINRLYGSVTNRVVSYFITDIDFVGSGDYEEKDELKTALTDSLKIFSRLQQAGVEWAIYGNAYVRCVEPFDRWLVDDRDGKFRAIALDTFPDHLVQYHWKTMEYEVPDISAASKLPKNKRKIADLPKVRLKFRDKPSADIGRFSINFLDPRYVELDKPHHAETIEYIYRIPTDMESRIKQNKLNEINHTPRGLLEAVAHGKDFRFRQGEVFHLKAPTPTGVSDSGWGVPEILLHYDNLYQLQVYRKADFAVAQDFLLPFRLFSPNLGSSAGDPSALMMMSQWKSQVAAMMKNRRKDPTMMHALPFPVHYQEGAGGGKSMVLKDVVEVYTDSLFDSLGFPRELYRGSINVQQLPNAVRMFERHYEWLYAGLDDMLKFVTNVVQRAFQGNELKVKLKRPAMAYNAEWMQLRMQLAANREIPRSDVYPDIGVTDPENAAARAVEEDQEIARQTAKLSASYDKELTQGSMADVAMMQAEQGMAPAGGGSAMGGAPPQGGAPSGGNYGVSGDDNPAMIEQRADEIAKEFLQRHSQQPNSHVSELKKIEATHPTLHAAVKQKMEKLRSGAESQGRAQVGNMIAEGG